MITENWLEWRLDLTELDIKDWINYPKRYTHEDYKKMGLKINKETKHGFDLYYLDTPYGKYYIEGQ